jgi:hypothetical protein
VRSLIAKLDGCTGGNAGEIVAAAGLDRMACEDVDRRQATKLLEAARKQARPVTPDLLGYVGRDAYPGYQYAAEHGVVAMGSSKPQAEIPFVIEAWARKATTLVGDIEKSDDDIAINILINRTPAVAEVIAWRGSDKKLDLQGNGLSHCCEDAPKKGAYRIRVNVTTPYCPITSDGKAPNLESFGDQIITAVETAMRKAQRAALKDRPETASFLPKRPRGRQSPESVAEYQEQVAEFCALIRQIKSTMDFAVGSRGWCYILERHGLRKGDFDAGQKLITECRKSGALPLDICSEDSSRSTIGIEQLDSNNLPDKIESLVTNLRDVAHEQYTPISIWDEPDIDTYVEVGTEKLDLRNLFEPVCKQLHVPITNFKGWSDVNSRAAMMLRFKKHEEQGRRCVLLLCGDHDPGGVHITEKMRKNLEDLSGAVGWSPDNVVIIRFGLNADFIDRHGLTWIDNLETSSGGQLDNPDHADHDKSYVQDYIDQFGVRKCEANALVVEPKVGRQLCRDAILQHIPPGAVERYERKLDRVRKQLRKALRARVS